MPARSADPRISALVGKVLADRYRIDEIIGVGGMGVVFRAHHLQLKRDVAIKVMRPEGELRDEAAARFMREAESAARLDHENCVRVYDFGVADDDIHFMVMPVLDGAPVKDVFDGLRTSPRRAMRIAAQLFAGLDHAHQRQVLHRDLKPDNLFWTRDDDGNDRVTIVDFGIAKIMEGEATGVTQAGTLYGTPAYMSPEQAAGDPLDARSDLFSAGLVLYRLLMGDVPGRAKTALDQLRKRASQEVPPLPPSFPEPVRELVAKLCALSPEERFQSAAEAALFTDDMLQQWELDGETHDQLVPLNDGGATRDDMVIADATNSTTTTAHTSTPPGGAWLPWAAGVIAAGSFALAILGLRGGDEASDEAQGELAAVTGSATDTQATAAGLPTGNADPGTATDDEVNDDEAAGDATAGQSEAGADIDRPANLLQQLAQVNTYDLERALMYPERHALMDELFADPQARPMINQRVNLALDLLQADQSDAPCGVFRTSLRAIEAARDPFFDDALGRAVPPRASDGEDAQQCEGLEAELKRVRRESAGTTATATATATKKTKKSKAGKSSSATAATAPPSDEGTTAPTGVKTGAVIEKLD